MGYYTNFEGRFNITPPLRPEHYNYLCDFSLTRRMQRRADLTATRPDPVREAAGLPVGAEGCYFVGEGEYRGQNFDARDIANTNKPPVGQPSFWCNWVPTEDCTAIVWDGGEKFYGYIEWIKYLIAHFLKPWGYTLNGEVYWEGEERDDAGIIRIEHNMVRVLRARTIYEEE